MRLPRFGVSAVRTRRHVLLSVIAATACAMAASGVASRAQAPADGIGLPPNAMSLEGVPTVRLEATRDAATRRRLDSREALGERLVIQIDDGRLIWSSRGGRPLTVTSAGTYTYLLSAQPGQYIRLQRLNDRLTYVEHLDFDARSVTYWGELKIVLGSRTQR